MFATDFSAVRGFHGRQAPPSRALASVVMVIASHRLARTDSFATLKTSILKDENNHKGSPMPDTIQPTLYEDPTVAVTPDHVVLKRYTLFGRQKSIRIDGIRTMDQRPIGRLERWRVAGAGPGTPWRSWYGWDAGRRTKTTAFVLDLGRFWRPTVTPDDPIGFAANMPG